MNRLLKAIEEDVCNTRRALHQIPEPGLEEYKTSKWLQDKLSSLGVSYEIVDNTGIIAFIKGKSPKKTIAFRADIDALSVLEESNFEAHSTHKGYMHACGHDGHMSMLIGLAGFLSQYGVEVNDDIVMIFQPAEEGPGGAENIVKSGILKKYGVDEIYGIHIFPGTKQGKIALCPGPMMAMTGEFDIDIKAKSAHGAMPHAGIDGLVIASECLLGLQTIVSRNIEPNNPVVLTIGKVVGGERRNIIAGNVRLEGTLRTFSQGVYNKMVQRMKTYLSGIASAYEIEIELVVRDMYPPVVNDVKLFDEFWKIGGDKCELIAPQMISEDFSYYQEAVPGLFYFIGSYNEKEGHVYPLHSSKFNFDNGVLMDGIESYIELLRAKGSIAISESE
ncbi:MAG: amidohydrolase [Clostridia bacterium]|nr:amidohydrolase [Clostridia bacterium]